MILDLSKEFDRQKFKQYANHLFEKKERVELTKKRKSRTINQNSFLHVVLTYYGLQLGYTLEEVKQDIFKRNICKEFFAIEKNGLTFFKSTKDLNTLEMTNAIEKFRNHAAKEFGMHIPAPDEEEMVEAIRQEAERYGNAQYI